MKEKVSRRGFMSRAAAAVAAPYVVPAAVLGRDGGTAPSERITVAGIGIHGRGFHDLRWIIGNKDVQVLAICDVWKQQRLAVKDFVDETYGNKDCAMYRDIREFLADRPDIDAVLIATGDHWHAPASVLLMRPLLPYALAFAAGAMIYVVVEELIPESQRGEHSNISTIGLMLGFVVMMALDVALG